MQPLKRAANHRKKCARNENASSRSCLLARSNFAKKQGWVGGSQSTVLKSTGTRTRFAGGGGGGGANWPNASHTLSWRTWKEVVYLPEKQTSARRLFLKKSETAQPFQLAVFRGGRFHDFLDTIENNGRPRSYIHQLLAFGEAANTPVKFAARTKN